MKTLKYITVFLTILLISQINAQSNNESQEKNFVKIQVDGLACPFCAYGLEKKLRSNIKDLDNLDINIEKGFVTFDFSKQNKPSKEKLKVIVSDAGFQAKKISFSDKPFLNKEEDK